MRRLVTLYDRALATPFEAVKLVLEIEFGRSIEDIFERFDVESLGSASIAQVMHLIYKVLYCVFFLG